jgi:biopolymer transport protein ExbB
LNTNWLDWTIDYGVIGILGVLSVLVIAIAIERTLYYRRYDIATATDLDSLKLALSDHLTFISAVASNAPYLGLLGTVFGIMLTFYKMGQGNAIDAMQIMTGLALALKATAVGLLVALVAVAVHHALARRADVLELRWKIARNTTTNSAGQETA